MFSNEGANDSVRRAHCYSQWWSFAEAREKRQGVIGQKNRRSVHFGTHSFFLLEDYKDRRRMSVEVMWS